MTYESVAGFSQWASLIMFVSFFAIAVTYALWPGNAKKFEQASRVPLQADENELNDGGQQ